MFVRYGTSQATAAPYVRSASARTLLPMLRLPRLAPAIAVIDFVADHAATERDLGEM